MRLGRPLAFLSLRTRKMVPPGKYLDDFRQRLRGLTHLPQVALDVGVARVARKYCPYE